MQITHEEARKLIQFHADQALSAGAEAILSAHLQVCAACQLYAREIEEIESLLRPVMKKKWQFEPPPHPAVMLQSKRNPRQGFARLTMRTALVSILVVALALGVQSILKPASQNPGEPAMVIAPAPTPSAFPTMTRATQQDCEATPYTVEAGDTLDGLASKFAVTEAELVRHNQLPTQLLRVGMVLKIPVCRSTPTGTVIATLFTRTQISVTGGAPSATGTGQ